jgi:hypothetical protein
MPLTMRPTGLGNDKDRPDYTVSSGELDVGRIYQDGGPDSLRWFWSMNANGPMTRSGRVATLEEAKAQFQKSWDAWKAWRRSWRRPNDQTRTGGRRFVTGAAAVMLVSALLMCS